MIAQFLSQPSVRRGLAHTLGALVWLAATPAFALDLNAQWLDSSGYRVDVVQDGSEVVALTTAGPDSGPWKRAEGRVRGRTLRLEVEGSRFEGRISEGFDRITWNSGAVWVRIPVAANPGDLMRRLQAAVAAEQPLDVASLVTFPMLLKDSSGAREVTGATSLQKELPVIFGSEARGDLEALDPYSVGRDWPKDARSGTIELGRARLRLAGSCADAECPPGEPDCAACTRWAYRVAAIEVLPAGPDSVAGLFEDVKQRLRAGRAESVGELLQYPIEVSIDGEPYRLEEPSHFAGFEAPIFDRTRDDLLDLGEASIDGKGRVRVRNGLFTLATACTGESALECAPGDGPCARQLRSEQCRKREPRITAIEIFAKRRYTQKVADLRADLGASGITRSGGRAAVVRDGNGHGRWLFLASSEERPVSAADGVHVAPLTYGDAPAGPHRPGSLRDVGQAAALEFPALSTSALLEGSAEPDARRGEVAVHPGPLELEGSSPRPYLVIRWISGVPLRFARVTAVLRRAEGRGDGVTVTATAPDGRNAQALVRQPAQRQLSFELDAIQPGQAVDLAIGPRGSAEGDLLFVSLRVEAIEIGSPDAAAAQRAADSVLGGGTSAGVSR